MKTGKYRTDRHGRRIPEPGDKVHLIYVGTVRVNTVDPTDGTITFNMGEEVKTASWALYTFMDADAGPMYDFNDFPDYSDSPGPEPDKYDRIIEMAEEDLRDAEQTLAWYEDGVRRARKRREELMLSLERMRTEQRLYKRAKRGDA